MLLLHGFPEDSGQWLGQLPALAAAGFRAVAFDQRGYSHKHNYPVYRTYVVLTTFSRP